VDRGSGFAILLGGKERGFMEDLSFRRLDEQIARVRERVLQHEKERRGWESDRRALEEKLHMLEGELARLREVDKRLLVLESENERYRKRHDLARQQVGRVLDRIRSVEE
jgi:chromosome segregation ATPase